MLPGSVLSQEALSGAHFDLALFSIHGVIALMRGQKKRPGKKPGRCEVGTQRCAEFQENSFIYWTIKLTLSNTKEVCSEVSSVSVKKICTV